MGRLLRIPPLVFIAGFGITQNPAPTHADVSFGSHPHQRIDICPPKDGAPPHPVLLWYGGIWKPAKHPVHLGFFHAKGIAVIAVIAVQVRTMEDATAAEEKEPVSYVQIWTEGQDARHREARTAHLQEGIWRDQRLLSEAWVRTASAKHVENGSTPVSDWNQGYGFQFWRCRHEAYRGDGAFGQYCVVTPEQDAVLAITSGLGSMQQVADLAWKHLLPEMKA